MSDSKPIGGPAQPIKHDADYHSRNQIVNRDLIHSYVTPHAMKGAKSDARYLQAMADDAQSAMALGRFTVKKARPNAMSRFAADKFGQMGKQTFRGMSKPASHKKHH